MACVEPARSSRGQTFKAHNTQNEYQILELNLLFQSFFVRRREMIMNSLQQNSNFKYVFPPQRLTSSIKQPYNVCRLVTRLVSSLDTRARIECKKGTIFVRYIFSWDAVRNTRTTYKIGGNFVFKIVGQLVFPCF